MPKEFSGFQVGSRSKQGYVPETGPHLTEIGGAEGWKHQPLSGSPEP